MIFKVWSTEPSDPQDSFRESAESKLCKIFIIRRRKGRRRRGRGLSRERRRKSFFAVLIFALNNAKEMVGRTAGASVHNKGNGTKVLVIFAFSITKNIKRKEEKPVLHKDVHFYDQ